MPTGDGEPVDFLTPSTMALAVMSSSLVALGISTGFDRQYGVLKRLGATPLGRGGLVAGKITAIGVVEVVQLLLLAGVGLALGWSPGGHPWMAPMAFVLGTAAFGGLGLLLAGTLRGTVVLAAANAVYLVLLAFGGMAFRLDELPDGARAIAELFPAAALSEVVRWTLTDGIETPDQGVDRAHRVGRGDAAGRGHGSSAGTDRRRTPMTSSARPGSGAIRSGGGAGSLQRLFDLVPRSSAVVFGRRSWPRLRLRPGSGGDWDRDRHWWPSSGRTGW